MSKKTTTTSTSDRSYNNWQDYTFDPTSMGVFQGLQPQIGATLGDFLSKPWESGFFQNALTRSSELTGQRASQMMKNILSPALGANISNPSAFLASQMRGVARGASRERADSLTNLLLGSQQLRSQALGQAMAYNPLITGQTGSGTEHSTSKQEQKTGGLGSWLPQVAGMGLSLLTGGMGGGLMGMFGGGGGGMAPYGAMFGPPSPNALMSPNYQLGNLGGQFQPQWWK